MPDIIRTPFDKLTVGRFIYTNPSGVQTVVEVEESPVGLAVRFSPNRFPTPLADIPVLSTFAPGPALNRRQFDELWVGDRFHRINSEDTVVIGELWTKLSETQARLHSKASIAMGNQGDGYLGDPVCGFDAVDLVSFVPV